MLWKPFKNKWITPPKDVHESYAGRNVIVTGATSGIGVEAAAKVAALGASKVIIAARDVRRGLSVQSALEKRIGKEGIFEVWELDLMSFDSVVAFAERARSLDHIDIVILNAGVWRGQFVQSTHGWETDIQVNTLSTTLLAMLLLPKLKESREHTAKIPVLEFTNSGLHQSAKIDPDALQSESILQAYNSPNRFKHQNQYKMTKLFLMYAANKLAEVVSSGDVIITSVCPGMVKTELGRDMNFPGARILIAIFGFFFFRTPEQGARIVVSGTTQGEQVHGRFWQHDRIQPLGSSIAGEENKAIALRVWNEIIDVLVSNVPRVSGVLDGLVSRAFTSSNLCLDWRGSVPHKPKSHGTSSLFRYLFPHTRQRVRAHLSKLRHEKLPSLRHRAQSKIYRYIVSKQAQRLKRKPGILQQLRRQTKELLQPGYLENEVRLRRQKLDTVRGPDTRNKDAMSYQGGYAEREPGARRKKFAGYLKAANEMRQSYQQQYASGWNSREASEHPPDEISDPTDAAIIRSGDEEMILFPSYARKHVKKKAIPNYTQPEAEPGTIQEVPGDGRDVRDTVGAGDAEFWKQRWDEYEDDNAIVDVDVRGWIYSPHKGQMSRKQRLFIGLARQLVGLQAPVAGSVPTSTSQSPISSRDPSPSPGTYTERQKSRKDQNDEILTAKEAEKILRRGEREAEMAAQGAYSEKPTAADSESILHRTNTSDSVRTVGSDTTAVQKRSSWNQPADMSPSELAEANARMMARLQHFLAIPMANSPISIFFFNKDQSRQRTVYTNPSGHFNICAALDFVPTHVRILASDKLSATEEILVTESRGISVISDIDDTIKHSAISAGAREIFRNAFIRDLNDLTIEGVKEWYNRMAELGIKFHYVSNSPWQLFPVISKYFMMAGLPPGSFHLKQYTGMLQGIFEPVAERKKGTLDKIARDFPERRFILIGDSGEADLEVYTDFVLENPGRVIAVFIRDVTTTDPGFFDQSVLPPGGDLSSSSSQQANSSVSSKVASAHGDEDAEMKAAIQASLHSLEDDNRRRSQSLFPTLDSDHPASRPNLPPRTNTIPQSKQTTGDLIDFSDDTPQLPSINAVRSHSDTDVDKPHHRGSIASTRSAPPPPRKPAALRSPSGDSSKQASTPSSRPPPPPKPRVLSSSSNPPNPPAQRTPTQSSTTSHTSSQHQDHQQTYRGMAMSGLSSIYNHLPAIRSTCEASEDSSQASDSHTTTTTPKKQPPPPPPPRRGVIAYPVAAASYVGTKAVSAWQNAPSSIPSVSLPRNVSVHPFSTTTAAQHQHQQQDGKDGVTGGTANPKETDYEDLARMGLSKREILWRQRWVRAEEILRSRGVVLRSWKVGSDAVGEAEILIREAEKGGGADGEAGRTVGEVRERKEGRR
ncbi:hypothetical protein M011DRAFT_440397 [Sporormia fimetaria CBS 119925]|uniref:Phosphatidate phosphatase APP1 catalytic domain-containing protein n=1 Tax=Sporormia fimetaria CBS 119925 TaxID=1340428 RepID=A0A6A6VEG5_9PLEO|nr:hypothetical protein M011DRAFT_440397 [Sporormia fimetaria CBS 119925]